MGKNSNSSGSNKDGIEAAKEEMTAGPTSREIAEFLARQYMAHDLVLAPITAMQPRRS